ncbi:beta-glucosidase [bacterium]|nr:MAG: beta-glucosidase [bacterium]
MPTPTPQSLLIQMNLDEKLAQLGSCWAHAIQVGRTFSSAKAEMLLQHGIGQITRTAGDSTLKPAAVAKFNNAMQNYLIKQTRLRIPAIVHEECCSGYMGLGGTMFPQMIGLSSTFQPELATKISTEIRKQLRGVGAHQGLAPVLDVARDSRWGRVEETFGEDPTLVSHFGVAYIRGLQGENLNTGIMATGKHFVGHSASQAGQNCAPAHIGIHDLWDTYLVPFQAAIRDAHIASIMNAYPELDGEVVAASRRILTDLLRVTLGFDGLVVSDYDAIPMIFNYHHAACTPAKAAALALCAGIDVELPSHDYYNKPLRAALESGETNLEFVDTAVERILRKKAELGLFENPFVDEGRAIELFETAPQRALAREIACKSMVLLKNNGALPLKHVKSLAVIGPNANDGRRFLGDYSYDAVLDLMKFYSSIDSRFENEDWSHVEINSVNLPSLLTALKTALPNTDVLYARGCDNLANDESGFDEALRAASASDTVLLVLGDRAGVIPNCTVGETRDSADLILPGVQEKLAAAIFATGKPVIVVLVTGRPYAINSLVEKADAILEAWLPGEEGAAAIAETLLGGNNPGGKLTMTFPRHVGQTPIYYNHKPSAGRSNWYVNYVSMDASPLYPFGHGLSYTTFSYSDLSLSKKELTTGETLDISFKITNTGSVTGDEVAQLYIQDEFACLPRPVQELKGYVRIGLAPAESKTVTFHLPVDQLAFYDAEMNLVVESGSFKVMVGSSSTDIRCEGKFEVTGAKKQVVKERVFVCPVST